MCDRRRAKVSPHRYNQRNKPASLGRRIVPSLLVEGSARYVAYEASYLTNRYANVLFFN